MLSDGVYVKAKPRENINTISLWLGASTIVELSFDEASKMLAENLSNAVNSLKQINEELAYIKDQKTTTEVNVARVYNYSIMENREAQILAAKKAEEE
jgi:prefoldin subunit 5